MQERGPVRMRVSDSIRSDITAGTYIEALPSMDKLAQRLGVSRVTVRNALRYLEEEGLIRIKQGSRTVIVNVPQASQESRTRSVTSELPSTINEAIGRYVQFLANSQIPREVRTRMIQIIDAQISLVDQLQQQTTNPESQIKSG